jgi:predicted NBD/HSP70 family sugar kinase
VTIPDRPGGPAGGGSPASETAPARRRGAGEESARIVDPSGGANQSRVRAWNERLVLSLIRRHGSLPKAEIARRSGLSAQTVTMIIRGLEEDGLLTRGTPRRGRVGQPSVPLSLDADAVFSIGLKIGRRSASMVLMDFVGRVRGRIDRTYLYPTPAAVLAFAGTALAEIEDALPADRRDRIAGLGIAMPFELWNWAEQVGATAEEMAAWRAVDMAAEIQALTPHPVLLQNDATAACGAELVFGAGAEFADFLYLFVGFFIGGGVVLNHALHPGRTGMAGAIGPLPVAGGAGPPRQILDHASIITLERALRAAGVDPSPLWRTTENWDRLEPTLEAWIRETGQYLALTIVAGCSFLDFEAVIVDGGFPEDVRARLAAATRAAMAELDLQGIVVPQVLEGRVGRDARAIGAAGLPLFNRYLLDRNVLFKAVGAGA